MSGKTVNYLSSSYTNNDIFATPVSISGKGREHSKTNPPTLAGQRINYYILSAEVGKDNADSPQALASL